jgi:hypothetical protein
MLSSGLALTTIFVKVGEPDIVSSIPLHAHLDSLLTGLKNKSTAVIQLAGVYLTNSLCWTQMKLWKQQKKKEKRFYYEVQSSSPLAQLYRAKEDNICQSIWDKGKVL